MADWNKLTEKYLSNVFIRLKAARVQLFVDKLQLGPEDTILDLGSEDGSYLAGFYPYKSKIILADINEKAMQRGVEKNGLGGYQVVSEDGSLPFSDQQFSAVWCNSVIEHVTVDKAHLCQIGNKGFIQKSHEHQSAFAKEVSRVAQKYFIQTPYVHYPIESHSWLPLVPYMSQKQRCFIAKTLKRLWLKQWSADFCLYDWSRFKKEFKGADEFLPEKTFGLTKSMIALKYSH